jgi:hypothetical protein
VEEGNGQIAGADFYFRGIKGHREFHAWVPDDLFGDSVVRHGDSPGKEY